MIHKNINIKFQKKYLTLYCVLRFGGQIFNQYIIPEKMEDILYDFIYLYARCPICKHTLMDNDQKVDGRPGIRLGIKTSEIDGEIILSSVYESYNYRCDIEFPKNEIVTFSCLFCNEILTSKFECEYCGAPMVPLDMDIGGKVSICSRSGCKGHFLEFEDITTALKKLYHLGEYEGELPPGVEETGEAKEIIESGSYLHTFCPHCDKSFVEKGLIKLTVINDLDEEGYVFLSPFLNVFSSKSTVFLKEDSIVKDVKCSHCESSLISENLNCGLCSSPSAKIAVSARTKLIDFYLCSKKGCRWHGLSEEDLHDIDLEDSLEW